MFRMNGKMKKLTPILVSFGERWLLAHGWRRTLIIAVTGLVYFGAHLAAFLSGGFEPFFFSFNFFLIILASASLGTWGGVAAAAVSGLIWGPFVMVFISTGHGTPNVVWIVRFAVLIVFGLLSGTVMSIFRYQIRIQRETNDRLIQAQKMEAIGRLTGGIAHDFNNMLTAIGGYAELIALETTSSPILETLSGEMLDVVNRSAKLNHQLLAISRQTRLETRPVDIEEEIQDLGKILARIIGDNIELHVSLAANRWKVDADPVRIDQVLMNLAVNAVDAMTHGGKLIFRTESLTVDSVFASQHPGLALGDHVMITVKDTGIGMDAETSSHVFEPFFTTKEAGKGTGLGLSTSYGIVKQLKGDIWFSSTPGLGTSFKVCLPRSREKTIGNEKGARTRRAGTKTADASVLVVEDNQFVRSVISRVLRYEGYSVMAADDAEKALKVIQDPATTIDVLITDLVMPQRTGLDVIESVYRLRPSIGVIVISGHEIDENANMEITALADKFLQKPFTGEQLLTSVHQLLG